MMGFRRHVQESTMRVLGLEFTHFLSSEMRRTRMDKG